MPIGISKSSAKDQRTVGTDNAKAVGVKARLTESGSFQLGDKATLSTGNVNQSVSAASGATVNVTDQGAVNQAIELAGSTNAGLLGLLGAKPESQSLFGGIMGASAGDTAAQVNASEKAGPDWLTLLIIGGVIIGAIFFFKKRS